VFYVERSGTGNSSVEYRWFGTENQDQGRAIAGLIFGALLKVASGSSSATL